MFINILILSVSLSLDAFGIGMSYSLNHIRIPFYAKCLIGIVSATIMWISLCLGDFMILFLPSNVMKLVGVCILVIIGITFIKNSLFDDNKNGYDFNHSLSIDFWEAIALGTALSADSFSAGIATAALGLGGFLIPISVGVVQVIFLGIGGYVMKKGFVPDQLSDKFCGVFSGVLLIFIAMLRGLF